MHLWNTDSEEKGKKVEEDRESEAYWGPIRVDAYGSLVPVFLSTYLIMNKKNR